MSKRGRFCNAIAAVLIAMTVPAAQAEDTLRVAAGQRGNWDTTIAEIGQRGGVFKKNGLSLEILYTQGAGETQQAVISGSVEIGVAPGIMGVLSAFSKGRAGTRHRRRNDRRVGSFLVRAVELADQIAEGHRRQDDRLFDQRLVDPRHRHGVHEAV